MISKPRPSVAESVQSANSSGHLFPVEIRQSQMSQQAPAVDVLKVAVGWWYGGYTSQYMSVCMSVYIYMIYIYVIYIYIYVTVCVCTVIYLILGISTIHYYGNTQRVLWVRRKNQHCAQTLLASSRLGTVEKLLDRSEFVQMCSAWPKLQVDNSPIPSLGSYLQLGCEDARGSVPKASACYISASKWTQIPEVAIQYPSILSQLWWMKRAAQASCIIYECIGLYHLPMIHPSCILNLPSNHLQCIYCIYIYVYIYIYSQYQIIKLYHFTSYYIAYINPYASVPGRRWSPTCPRPTFCLRSWSPEKAHPTIELCALLLTAMPPLCCSAWLQINHKMNYACEIAIPTCWK